MNKLKRKVFSVALIGADGSGKTTIANKLQKAFYMPVKYLYMGINIESGNVVLPTSKLIQFIKIRKRKGQNENTEQSKSLHAKIDSPKKSFRKIRSIVRLVNRLAEAYYRQLISSIYQIRGYIVIYDRHFLFDFAGNGVDVTQEKQRLSDRLFRWSLKYFYPKPDLVIFLSAPAEVLFSRKEEATIDFLKNIQNVFREQGKKTANFVEIDASQSLEKVYREVYQCVKQFSENLL